MPAPGGAEATPTCLVDVSVFVFKAWFTIDPGMTDSAGRPVNAVYGFGRFLADVLYRLRPARLALAFDESLSSSFRNDILPAYKANREPAPPELEAQFRLCRRLAESLGIACYASDRYEADDLIATLARRERQAGRRVQVLTRDKDLSQVLREGDEFWDFPSGRRVDYQGTAAVFGATPERMADYLALVGDKVDNIPGVPGVGAKTASVLMSRFDSLESVYAGLDELPGLGLRRPAMVASRLEEHRDAAFLARRLVRLVEDVAIPGDGDLDRKAFPDTVFHDLRRELGFSERWCRRALEVPVGP
ncbi:MAG: 5'-3' exonuclease H3TH domain-containing protein [Gammaproteobacteria bacterium]